MSGQVIGRNIFQKQEKHFSENKAGRLVPDLIFVFKKSLYEVMQVVCSLVSIYSDSPHFAIQQKQTKANFRLSIQRYVYFDFLEKSLEIVSPPYFVCDFSRRMFLMLCSIK